MFLHRDTELDVLENDYTKPNSSFNFVFGRSKIGKTAFIKEYIKNKNSFYISFLEVIEFIGFKNIHNSLEKSINKKIKPFNNFQTFLNTLASLEFDNKFVLVLDDFQNFLKIEKDALSIFYKYWLKDLSLKNIQVVLLSSLKSSKSEDKYIYNKSSNILELSDLPYCIIKTFLPKVDKKHIVYIYTIFGTNPDYIKFYNPNISLTANFKNILLSKDNHYFNEGINILKRELNDISTYSSILYAISLGNNKIGDIASYLNLKSTYLTRYMQKLIDLMIIKKHVPINEDTKNSKFGRYEIEDNFMKFWFCCIYPNQSALIQNNLKEVVIDIKNNFSNILIKEAYKKHILELANLDPYSLFGFIPRHIGSWWNNKDTYIDIVAYDSKQIIFGDTKWKNRQDIKESYSSLKEKSDKFQTILNKNYIIFSKN